MEEFYNIWNGGANEALFTEENIATITAAEPKGKNFRQDYLDIVRTIPGLGIHPNVLPRKKKFSDVKQGEDDNPDALFDVDGFDPDSNTLKSSGLTMDSTTLLCLLVLLQKYPNITSLDLSHSGLTTKSIDILNKYLPETSVTQLIIDYNNDVVSTCEVLLSPKNKSKLHSFSIRGCNVNDECAARIAQTLSINGLLVELNLFGNQITDIGGTALAKMFRYNHSIVKLFLGNNRICSSFLNFAKAVSKTYGPLTEEEKQERKEVEALQQENLSSSGGGGDKKSKKGKKGGHVAQPLRVDAMDTDSGICNGNDVLKFLDLTLNGPLTEEDVGAISEYFSKEETHFCDSFRKLDASGSIGIDEDLSKLIINKIEGTA